MGGYNGYKYNNSKEGIDKGILDGYRVIEVDVGITSDNNMVLTHRFEPDDEIIFEGRPSLDDFLKKGALEGETALSLEMFVDLYKDTDTYFLVDCAHGIEINVAERLSSLCKEEFFDKIIFQVHTKELLDQIYKMKKFKHIHYNNTSKKILDDLPFLIEKNVHTCSIADREIKETNCDLKQILQSGLHIFAYVVNHDRRLRHDLRIGVSGIFTDAIKPKMLD